MVFYRCPTTKLEKHDILSFFFKGNLGRAHSFLDSPKDYVVEKIICAFIQIFSLTFFKQKSYTAITFRVEQGGWGHAGNHLF